MSKNKKCVYFTRHGQTFWNVEDKICGSTDIALTDMDRSRQLHLDRKFWKKDCRLMRFCIHH